MNNTTPLAAPSVTISASGSTLQFSWPRVAGATNYDYSISLDGRYEYGLSNTPDVSFTRAIGSKSGEFCVRAWAEATGRVRSSEGKSCVTVAPAATVVFGNPGCAPNRVDRSNLKFTITNNTTTFQGFDLKVDGHGRNNFRVAGGATASYTLAGIPNGVQTASVWLGTEKLDEQRSLEFTCDRGREHPKVASASDRVPVLSIRFLPDKDGDNVIDHADTDYTGTVAQLRSQIEANETEALWWATEATRPFGRLDPAVLPRIGFDRINTIELTTAVPRGQKHYANPTHRPDYEQILNGQNICDYVDNQGVREVWIWTQHKAGAGFIEPAESIIATPHSELTTLDNSEDPIPIPTCGSTYTMYNFNFALGAVNTLHNRGHQAEAMFRWVGDASQYTTDAAVWASFVSNCGNTHFPPNGTRDYDYSNTSSTSSPCEGWLSGSGTAASYDCAVAGEYTFGVNVCSDPDQSQLAYLNWMFQRFPGSRTTLDGSNVRGFWEIFADIDRVHGTGNWLVVP